MVKMASLESLAARGPQDFKVCLGLHPRRERLASLELLVVKVTWDLRELLRRSQDLQATEAQLRM